MINILANYNLSYLFFFTSLISSSLKLFGEYF